MANIINNKLECLMLFLLTFSYVLSDRFVDGRKIGTTKLVKPKGTIKTIEGKDGEIIDCVDLYQQPALDHPLLKNHTIQTEPCSIPSNLKANSSPVKLIQGWHKSGQCPEATIPILRAPKNQHHPALRHLKRSRTQHNQSLDSNDGDNLSDHEYAVAYFGGGGSYLGSHATLNVWKPTVEGDGEMSLGQIWLVNGPAQEINTLEAGWRVDSDQKSKFFIYWTSDNYQNTGCENLDCPGFVQTSKSFAIGSALDVSVYNSKQVDIGVAVYLSDDKWWLKVNDQAIGYWPISIYKYLKSSAARLDYGGEIYNAKVGGRHTKTQMGSGHFPSEGYGKAGYFRHIQYMDSTGSFKDVEPGSLGKDAAKPSCYDIQIQSDKSSGTNFYFGGPGYSADKCP
ncbi:hypothetical protein RGQ29_021216 [Quercus rubra]|uniref:Neprosin PEP catalytic domain-containing protein n=1 Tax=Quercus rubra TaxID=3512 RepID=A0AAN7FII1_QUERU|nr:hypothetical protein RGQ29_032646 [Quercus rubra]KAK4590930.1 hypothetical protein RGQ29_021216 [Quercus rubra]